MPLFNLRWAALLVVLTTGCSESPPDLGQAGTTEAPADTESESETESTGIPDPPSDSDAEESEGDTNGFVPDAGTDVCGSMCDPWAEQDCPEGEKCSPVACEFGSNAWDSTVCRPIQGDKAEGEPCQVMGDPNDGHDDCGNRLFCWDPDPDTGMGRCVSWCEGSPELGGWCDDDHICNFWKSVGAGMCTPKCDPLLDECPLGCTCIPAPSDEGFTCVLDASGGMGPYGTPCSFANSCNLGLICIAAAAVPAEECTGADACCSEVCDVTAENTCAGKDGGQTCEPFYEDGLAPAGFEHVGVCAVAAEP